MSVELFEKLEHRLAVCTKEQEECRPETGGVDNLAESCPKTCRSGWEYYNTLVAEFI